MGIGESLLSAQLSDHEEKHLSLRRLSRVPDVGLWKEFALLLLEDLGFTVIVLDQDQASAFHQLQAASAKFTQEMIR
jgi:hypothetical protein